MKDEQIVRDLLLRILSQGIENSKRMLESGLFVHAQREIEHVHNLPQYLRYKVINPKQVKFFLLHEAGHYWKEISCLEPCDPVRQMAFTSEFESLWKRLGDAVEFNPNEDD